LVILAGDCPAAKDSKIRRTIAASCGLTRRQPRTRSPVGGNLPNDLIAVDALPDGSALAHLAL
jgi:hypothetical protein